MKRLNILLFGAHPDDAEIYAGGCAALWARQGHRVKIVSTTNGDVGHAFKCGAELAALRKLEVEAAARVLGVETQVLDIHDGELMPTLENRLLFLKIIREWNADLVITHRPYDYHPDHRYTGVLVQDSAFMVTVKHTLPEVPCLVHNPLFLYAYDNFQTPMPFKPHIVVPIDAVLEQKLDALWCLESQVESLWSKGNFTEIAPVPTDASAREKRKREFFATWNIVERWRVQAQQYRSVLEACYGAEQAAACTHAEAFEVCEYGQQPSPGELVSLFPKLT